MRAGLLLLLLPACRREEGATQDCVAADSAVRFVDLDCDGVEEREDCDDTDAEVGGPLEWYRDVDSDGYGDARDVNESCGPMTGRVANDSDCNDHDPAINPDGQETCEPGDEDCDGFEDDADATVQGKTTWYTDADGDGYGADAEETSCDAPRETSAEPGDCDDSDPDRYPGARCRPDAGCTHADVAQLAEVANLGISDLAFDEDCNAYLPNILVSDSIQVVHASGLVLTELDTWAGICDLPALALAPDDGDIWIMGTDNSYAIVGRVEGDAVEKVADGTFTKGTSWAGTYLNWVAQSITSDGTCVWVPNFAGNGTVVCVTEDGAATTLATLPARVESVALDPDGALYASSGADIYQLDTTGAATVIWTLSATVLDMVFDYDGTLYVETTADELWTRGPDGDNALFADVSYDGKLAISPDGWLVRVMPYPSGGTADEASGWEEWELGD